MSSSSLLPESSSFLLGSLSVLDGAASLSSAMDSLCVPFLLWCLLDFFVALRLLVFVVVVVAGAILVKSFLSV